MKALYFDCFSGISGDMTLGALLDLGLDEKLFRSELAGLNLGGYDIVIEKVKKNRIVGTDIKVILHDEQSKHHTGHHGERNLADIEKLIEASALAKSVKEFSLKVFREIAEAEAKVHNAPIHEIHFHEVGAIDSIVDIVGAGIALEMLGIHHVYASPVHDGHGFITCRHGVLPVPVPAVMEILTKSNIPYVCDDVNTELVTPTGIGLLKCLSPGFGLMPAMKIDRIGYGFGKRETGRFNALRVVAGDLYETAASTEEIAELETNIDDMNPEILGYVMEKLFQEGALDVYTASIYMKKNRPAVMLTVLAELQNEEKIKNILFTETSTLGIRRTMKQRYCMAREIMAVNTPYGEIRVKVATLGDLKKVAPEYEDCKKAAQTHGVSLLRIYNAVNEAAKHLL